MYRKVSYVSRRIAERMRGCADTVVISITDPDAEPARLADGFRAVHRSAFWDVTQKWVTRDGERWPISLAQAEAMVRFINGWHDCPDPLQLLVHCEAGLSRSAAVARYIHERYGVEVRGEYPDCMYANIEVLSRLEFVAGARDPGCRRRSAFGDIEEQGR